MKGGSVQKLSEKDCSRDWGYEMWNTMKLLKSDTLFCQHLKKACKALPLVLSNANL